MPDYLPSIFSELRGEDTFPVAHAPKFGHPCVVARNLFLVELHFVPAPDKGFGHWAEQATIN